MNLFDGFYQIKEETLSQLKKPATKRKLKRLIESYHDSCLENQMNIADRYTKKLEKLDKLDKGDIENMMEDRQRFDRYAKLAEQTRKFHEELFGAAIVYEEIDLFLIPEEDGEHKNTK